MADDGTFALADRQSAMTLQKVVRYVGGMMRAKIPGGSNGPNGPVFPDDRESPRPVVIPEEFILRVADVRDAQGRYKAYVQKWTESAGNYNGASNVSAAQMLQDGEEVTFLNWFETASGLSTPSGSNRIHLLATNSVSYVHAFKYGSEAGSGTARAVFANNVTPTATPFVVNLTKTGGTDGTGTSSASWTYTVKTRQNVTIATSVSLLAGRPFGKMDFGLVGLAFIDVDGSFKLLWADETRHTTFCPE